ncbi:MAG: mechanosensitive ion channel [Sphingobium sp.]|nr:mechanosensitive ion channel [Sphingobium sp.]MCP5399320.1 mechanosensitive ion channel [Sphingomonas sp.]
MDDLAIGGYRFDPALAQELVEKAIIVAAILVVTWLLAKAAKWSFAHLAEKVSLFRRADASGQSVGESLGKIISLFVWLFGLLAVLQALDLDSVIAPVQELLNSFIGFLPKIIGAAIIFFVGAMIAKIAREIVETALSSINFDKWANMGGAEAVTGNSAISKTIGTIVFILVIVPVGIAALDVLNIPAITVPAREMLEMVLQAVPLIIGASLLLGLGYVIARWVSKMIQEVLPGLGFDRAVAAIGIVPEGRSASGIVATLVNIAIMLFMAIAATRLLGFPELTRIVETILDQGANVIFGAVLIAAGALLAKILRNLIATAAGEGFAPALVYWLTVGLFIFIGIKQMDIGGLIIDYAFLAIAIGTGVAFALAFGLGGREVAARKLNDMVK